MGLLFSRMIPLNDKKKDTGQNLYTDNCNGGIVMLIKLENNELINIPKEIEFRIFLREDDGRYDLMLSTAKEADYEVIHGLGEGAGGEFSDIIREMYMHQFFQRVENSLYSDNKTIDVITVYEDVLENIESFVKKKQEKKHEFQ